MREKEYAMLRAIGLMPSSLKHIIVYEITILTTVGLLLGYILSIVSTKILHSYFSVMIGNYMYQIPFIILLPISVFIVLVLGLSCIPLIKRINNIQVIRGSKQYLILKKSCCFFIRKIDKVISKKCL
ncbi:MAG TPA: FtsX-like permease family protein [Acetivibrio saccincola]|nr:FtsX-like permease family protein [Acetivibrio saccincola]